MINNAINAIKSMLYDFNLLVDPMVLNFTGTNPYVEIIAFIDTSKISDSLVNTCRTMNSDTSINLKFDNGSLNMSDPQTFILKFILDLEGCNDE